MAVLSTPITSTLGALDGELEEVSGTGDAGIVVADRLLAAQRQRLVGQVDPVAHDRAQILLDRELVLRGWRDYLGIEDRALIVDLVTVVAEAARRLAGAVADARRGVSSTNGASGSS